MSCRFSNSWPIIFRCSFITCVHGENPLIWFIEIPRRTHMWNNGDTYIHFVSWDVLPFIVLMAYYISIFVRPIHRRFITCVHGENPIIWFIEITRRTHMWNTGETYIHYCLLRCPAVSRTHGQLYFDICWRDTPTFHHMRARREFSWYGLMR